MLRIVAQGLVQGRENGHGIWNVECWESKEVKLAANNGSRIDPSDWQRPVTCFLNMGSIKGGEFNLFAD
jgi:hypothetical protein